MVKRYGPTFSAGDTIGCGVDYVERGIFYTLNGTFLGYAWKGIDDEFLTNDLFPVVGLDTNCPLHLNFGTDGGEAFQFDLASFLMDHKNVIAPLYRLPSSDDGCDGGSAVSGPSRSRSNGSHPGLFKRQLSTASVASSTPSRRRRHFGRRGAADRR
jgi:SPRY domain